jgi:hypothetical protein
MITIAKERTFFMFAGKLIKKYAVQAIVPKI